MGQRFLSTRLPSLSMNHALQGGVDACEAGVLNPACPELSSCPGADFHVTFSSKCRKPAGGVQNSQIKLGAKCFLCNLNTNLKSSSMAFKGINQLLSNRRILALIPHFHFGGKKKMKVGQCTTTRGMKRHGTLTCLGVFVRQHVIGERRRVSQTL